MCPCQSLIGCGGSPVLAEEKVKWAFVLHLRNASKCWSEINTPRLQFSSFVGQEQRRQKALWVETGQFVGDAKNMTELERQQAAMQEEFRSH